MTRRVSIPTGLRPSAQGCRVGEATLGHAFDCFPQPQRGCVNHSRASGFNPFRVVESWGLKRSVVVRHLRFFGPGILVIWPLRLWLILWLVHLHCKRDREIHANERRFAGAKCRQECGSGTVNLSASPLYDFSVTVVDESVDEKRSHLA